MKVLYFTRDYTPHDFRFLKAIVENGDDVWYMRLEKRNFYENREIPDGVHVIDWKYGQAPFDIDTEGISAVAEFRQEVEKIKPDIIHSGPLTDCSWIAAEAGFHPHVVMSWGFDLGREIETSNAALNRAAFALSKADWFLGDCYTELEKAVELGYKKDKSTIFPWGIDVERFSPGKGLIRSQIKHGGEFLVLSLRTMEPNYDVETVVRAFLLAVQKEPGMRLILLGDGSQMSLLKELAQNDLNGDKIFFLGRQPNDMLIDYYRSCDLYVSASIVDGSSVSLLEAMGTGIPVLMSAIPGNLEWVKNGQNGQLFPVKDIEELSDKMIYSFNHREQIKEFAAVGRQLIEDKADWNKNKKKIHDAYRKAFGA